METSTALDEYNATVWSNATALNVTPTLGAGGGGWKEDGVSTPTVDAGGGGWTEDGVSSEADMALTVMPTLGAGDKGLAEDGVSTEADRALTICYIIIGTIGIIGKSISFLFCLTTDFVEIVLGVFLASTLELPFQTLFLWPLNVPVCARSGEKCGQFRKTSTTLPSQSIKGG